MAPQSTCTIIDNFLSIIQNSGEQLHQQSRVHQQRPPKTVQKPPLSSIHQILADQMASNFRSQHQPLPHQVQKVHVKKVYYSYLAHIFPQVCEILVIFAISRIRFALKLPHMCAHQNSIWKQAKDGLISESFLIWLTCPKMDGKSLP